MGNLFDLTGKTAVAFGGNSTLGAAMCKGLAATELKLRLLAVTLKRLKKLFKKLKQRVVLQKHSKQM